MGRREEIEREETAGLEEEGGEQEEEGDDVIIVYAVELSNRKETTIWVRCTCLPLLWNPPSR